MELKNSIVGPVTKAKICYENRDVPWSNSRRNNNNTKSTSLTRLQA